MVEPCTPVTGTAPDGATLTACGHGGQVLGWVPAGGTDRLWTSPLAVCGPGSAIRGGVPVVFPQFSDRGDLPKHGVVRDRAWTGRMDGATWTASLDADEATRSVWPVGFSLALTASAYADTLDLTLTVRALDPLEFMAALHLYLRIGDPATTVTGLGDLPAEDNAAGRAATRLPGGPSRAVERRDVAVRGVTGPVRVDDPALGSLTLDAQGFADRVLWHPGTPSGLADVPPGGEAEFFCLEPAALSPVALDAGDTWTGRVRLRA